MRFAVALMALLVSACTPPADTCTPTDQWRHWNHGEIQQSGVVPASAGAAVVIINNRRRSRDYWQRMYLCPEWREEKR